MSGRVDIAVVSPTGAVGEALLGLLEERNFPAGELFLLDEEERVGESVRRFGKSLKVQSLAAFDFAQAQLAFFCGDAALSHANAIAASEAGCVVIDSSGAFTDDPEVPLVIPEVNPEVLDGFRQRNIIASPSPATTILLSVLKPLHDAVGIARADVVTYMAVSEAGKAGVDELSAQVVALLNMRDATRSLFPERIAFNLVPQVGAPQENGYSGAEMALLDETRKILAERAIALSPTAVLVPVFYGHSMALHLQTEAPLGVDEARAILAQAPGIVLDESPSGPTPAIQAAEQDAVHVGRLREDLAGSGGLNLWITSDNNRKGGSLNAVQIAELLQKCYM